MAKTRTFGVRLTPELVGELERLKEAFSFTSYGEMIESWVRLLQNIDESVCRITEHPREWRAQDMEQYFFLNNKHPANHFTQVDDLKWRRLRERFGEDGVQRIQEIVSELNSGVGRRGG